MIKFVTIALLFIGFLMFVHVSTEVEVAKSSLEYCHSIGFDAITNDPRKNWVQAALTTDWVCVKEYDNLTRVYRQVKKDV